MYKSFLTLIIAILFSSCTFLKSTEDHKRFAINQFEKSILKQKRPEESIESNPEKYAYITEIDFTFNIDCKRKLDGTILTTINYYQYYPLYEECTSYYTDVYGYRRYYNSTRLKSILKRPGGKIQLRTAYDGEEIYIINTNQISDLDDEKNKSTWSTIRSVYKDCR
jgi:hypothetical protein